MSQGNLRYADCTVLGQSTCLREVHVRNITFTCTFYLYLYVQICMKVLSGITANVQSTVSTFSLSVFIS